MSNIRTMLPVLLVVGTLLTLSSRAGTLTPVEIILALIFLVITSRGEIPLSDPIDHYLKMPRPETKSKVEEYKALFHNLPKARLLKRLKFVSQNSDDPARVALLELLASCEPVFARQYCHPF